MRRVERKKIYINQNIKISLNRSSSFQWAEVSINFFFSFLKRYNLSISDLYSYTLDFLHPIQIYLDYSLETSLLPLQTKLYTPLLSKSMLSQSTSITSIMSSLLLVSTWTTSTMGNTMKWYDSSSISDHTASQGGNGNGQDPLLNNPLGDIWWKEAGETGFRSIYGTNRGSNAWTISTCPAGTFIRQISGRSGSQMDGLQWSCTDGTKSQYFGYGSESKGIQGNNGDPFKNYCQPDYNHNNGDANGCGGTTFNGNDRESMAWNGVTSMKVFADSTIGSIQYKDNEKTDWNSAGTNPGKMHDKIYMEGMKVSGFAIEKSTAYVNQISIIFRPMNQNCDFTWANATGSSCSFAPGSTTCGSGKGLQAQDAAIKIPASGTGTACPKRAFIPCDLPCKASSPAPSPPPPSPASSPPPPSPAPSPPPPSPASSPPPASPAPSPPTSPASSPSSTGSASLNVMSVSVDCAMDGNWTNIGSCVIPLGGTKTCDCGTAKSGIQTQTQGIKTQPQNGGKSCDSAGLTQTIACKLPECPLAHRAKRRVVRF